MKKRISIVLLFIFGIAFTNLAQIEKVIVETYYIANSADALDTTTDKLEEGSVTYRIYLDLKPGNKLMNVYGDLNHPLKFSSTKPFYNNIDGETYAYNFKKGLYGDNTIALDTWLTLGQTTKTQSGKTYFGILKTFDTDGSFIGGSNNSLGLLANTSTALGIPLTSADGMDTMVKVPGTWSSYGVKDFLSGLDSTIFGSLVSRSEFSSKNVFLKNSGVSGVIPEQNQILIAQLTTKGNLSFELNVEVEQLVNNVPTIIKYVANDSIMLPGEKKSTFLKYPFEQSNCGCFDPNYIEYDPNLECFDNASFCKTKIVYGCMDTMACNFDPGANFSIPTLCCYPGSCAGRDISVVCPSIKGNTIEFDFFPNPVTNSIFLNVSSGTKEEMSFTIYNSFGSSVHTENIGLKQSLTNYEVDLSELEIGFYLIRINVGNKFLSKQFLKNN